MDSSNTISDNVPVVEYAGTERVATNEQPKKWWKTLKIELFFILHLFGFHLGFTAVVSLYMDRACSVNYNKSKEVCNNLTAHQDILDRVQRKVNDLTVYNQLVMLLPSLIFTVCSGPFNDKYGRKPALTIAVIGRVVNSVYVIFLIYWDTLLVEYFLLSNLIISSTGGTMAMNGNIYCMITDSSSRSSRTLRFAVFEVVKLTVDPAASMIAGQVWKHFGYLPVFASALALNVLAMGFFVIFVEDTRKNQLTYSWKSVLSDICSLNSLKENYHVCLKKRENLGRTQIWMIFVGKLSLFIGKSGIRHDIFFFVNKLYGWDLARYTLVTNSFKFANIFLAILIVPLLIKVTKIRDTCLGLISMLLITAQCTGRAFAYVSSIFYATSILESVLPDISATVLRSKISKLVPENELGKIFCMISVIEEVIPSASTFMFAIIYNHTLDFFPGMIFLVASAFFAISIGIFIWFLRLNRDTNVSYDQLDTNGES